MTEILTQRDLFSAQGNYVAKGNDLIQKSRYSLSLMEQKAVLFIISKITPYDEPNKEYVFKIKDFVKTCNFNTSSGRYADYLVSIMESIAEKVIVIETEPGKRLVANWFSSAEIDEKTNTITITFDRKLTPYLFQLKSFYTQYRLEYVLAMKSKYSVRLYELLKSVKYIGYKYRISLDELREKIDCLDKYPNYKDFRLYVLDKAIKEINAYTDIKVSFKAYREGKKVNIIEFILLSAEFDEVRQQNRREKLGEMKRD